ncbi:unnamed protein product [Zymoseptoria tritici ST99CH_3D7]|uniref:Uncharacterized protein n=1 Tax=Zymoseptoria tritici (strain ST99CH_3D7) TaxID=1276538 RepID=A0A1X7S5G7_ZYMT9|nr:unnamed protein product [Zymoseptoria tritici ST99CH_3D7]
MTFVTPLARIPAAALAHVRAVESGPGGAYILVTVLLLLCCYSTLIHPEFISPLRHIPKAKYWLPQKLYYQLVLRRTPAEALSQLARETPNNGLLALREPTGVLLLVTKPSVLGELLVARAADFEKPTALQGFFKQLTLDGLLTVNGEKHKSLKKRSLSHFNFRAVKNLYPLMWRHALQFAGAVEANFQKIENHQNGTCSGTVELTHLTTVMTINVIGTTVFGRAFEAPDDGSFSQLGKLLQYFLQPSASTSVYLALTFFSPPWVSKYLTFPLYRAAAGTSAAMERLCLQIIQKKRLTLKADSQDADLTSLMIQSGHFTDYEIASQLLTYTIAGQETTAATMNWICYLLALDPARQRLLREEVSAATELLVDSGIEENIGKTLEGLPFLNGVINEALRLYPTVPLSQRVAVRDTSLAGSHVPKGTSIYLSPWLIQRSEDVWGQEANEFRPERWIRTEDGESRVDPSGGMSSNMDFLTFLHGPRNCIGQNFAKAELRCLTTALTKHFEWALDQPRASVPVSGLVTINPEGGLSLRVTTVEGTCK